MTNQNSTRGEIKCILKVGNSQYYSIQTILTSQILSKNWNILYVNIAESAIMVSYIKAGMHAKGIWKKGQRGMRMGLEKVRFWGTS